jgi:hypothetical protein
MAALPTSSARTLKIKFDDDLRRVQVALPSQGTASDKVRALRAAVGACFDINVADLPALKYQDDDGDLCTLIEASVEDMFTLAADGPLYLFASLADEMSVEAPGTADLADAGEFQEEAVPADKSESLIAPLLAMGFAEADAIRATEKAKGRLEVAVAILLKGNPPKRRSYFARLFPQFSVTPGQSAVLQRSDPPQEDLAEVDAFLLSNSAAIDEERNTNVHSHTDMTMNEDIAADAFLLRDETVQVDSFGEVASAEGEVVEESPADCFDAERVSMSLDSNEASREGAAQEAFAGSVSASALDKGQILGARFLSKFRTRQAVSERLSSSVVIDEENDVNLRSHVDDAMNDDIAVGMLQNWHNETDDLDSPEEASAPDDEVVQESNAGFSDVEHVSGSLGSDEASLKGAAHASPLDKGQVLVSHVLSAFRKKSDINYHRRVDDEDAMDSLQHVDEQRDQVHSVEALEQFLDQPPQISGRVQEAASSEDVLVVEACAELHGAEHISADSASDEASLETTVGDASEQATNASVLRQGQVFATCLLSAARTRQFIPESISSSGSNETRFDRVQRCISDSLFDLRSKMQPSPLPQAA